ncbi:MAG: hypothetical protein WDN45_10180 [Caulobacteraceae bacterium]
MRLDLEPRPCPNPPFKESAQDPGKSRRDFLRFASAAAVAAPIMTEAALARAAAKDDAVLTGMALHGQGKDLPPADAVLINANENPLGPCKTALQGIVDIAPMGRALRPAGRGSPAQGGVRRPERAEGRERRDLRRLLRAAALHGPWPSPRRARAWSPPTSPTRRHGPRPRPPAPRSPRCR